MKNYEDWQTRVIEEADELASKMNKLVAYVAKQETKDILLEIQLTAMNTYLTVLDKRIASWEK